jgi:hypothetical protein
MTLEEIKQELLKNGKDPEDFDIVISESGHLVTPKWYYQHKQITRKEIEPVEQENISNMLAMTQMYEENLKLKQENVDTMVAVTELYEMMLGGTV